MTYRVEHMQMSSSAICGPSLVRCLLRSMAHFLDQEVPPFEVCKPATFSTFMVPLRRRRKLGVWFCSWGCPSGLLSGLFCAHTMRVLQHTPISKEGLGLRCPTPALRLTRDYKCYEAESLRLCDERFLLVRFPFHYLSNTEQNSITMKCERGTCTHLCKREALVAYFLSSLGRSVMKVTNPRNAVRQ